MSDLVGRLRTHVAEYYSGRPVDLALCKDAADEIERLRERLAKLQGTGHHPMFSFTKSKPSTGPGSPDDLQSLAC
jgi:hypothetical protein